MAIRFRRFQIVDLMNTNSELREIEDELSELREQNTAAEKGLNELFEDRRSKEEAIRELEKEIEEEKARNIAAVHSMVVFLMKVTLRMI